MLPHDWVYVIRFQFFKPCQTIRVDLGPGSYEEIIRSIGWFTMLSEAERSVVAAHFKTHHLRKAKLRDDSLNCRLTGMTVDVETYPAMLEVRECILARMSA